MVTNPKSKIPRDSTHCTAICFHIYELARGSPWATKPPLGSNQKVTTKKNEHTQWRVSVIKHDKPDRILVKILRSSKDNRKTVVIQSIISELSIHLTTISDLKFFFSKEQFLQQKHKTGPNINLNVFIHSTHLNPKPHPYHHLQVRKPFKTCERNPRARDRSK